MRLRRPSSLPMSAFVIGVLIVAAAQISTPTVEQLDEQVHHLETRLPGALAEPSRVVAILPRLDAAGRTLAALAYGPPYTEPHPVGLHHRLDAVLRSDHERYRKAADDCDWHKLLGATQECGQAREVATRSGYFLGWLNYSAAYCFYVAYAFRHDQASPRGLRKGGLPLENNAHSMRSRMFSYRRDLVNGHPPKEVWGFVNPERIGAIAAAARTACG